MSLLTLLSCNIHKGFAAGNRHFTLHRLGDALCSANPDVAFLQEVQGEHRGRALQRENWIPDQAGWLARRLDADHAYAANANYLQGHHGNAIISRQPLLGWANHDVSNHRFERRGLLHASIQVEGRIVHLICCHLDLTGWGRQRQLERLNRLIREAIPEQAPLVVAGDFNDWRGHITVPGLVEAHVQRHGHHARTFPAWSPRLTLDRMYLRHAVVREVEVLTQAPWPSLSDHVPLRCVINLA